MPSRESHELAFKSLRNINERTMSLERCAFFGTEVCKRRSDFWSETGDSMKIAEPNQPATDNCPWDKLITLQTFAVFCIIKSLPRHILQATLFHRHCFSEYPDSFQYISPQTVCSQTLRVRYCPNTRGKFRFDSTRVWFCSSSSLFADIT